MKPHKHAEVIKAWSDGADIEYLSKIDLEWHPISNPCEWAANYEYRIKPEPKPDLRLFYWYDLEYKQLINTNCLSRHNLILTIDGVTGKLKSAEVL